MAHVKKVLIAFFITFGILAGLSTLLQVLEDYTDAKLQSTYALSDNALDALDAAALDDAAGTDSSSQTSKDTATSKNQATKNATAEEASQGTEEEIEEDITTLLWEDTYPRYYYDQLSETEQGIYDQIYRAIILRREVKVSTISQDTLDKLFACVMYDHPEIYYISGYSFTKTLKADEVISITFSASYDYTEEEVAARDQQILVATKHIISGISQDASDFEKVKYVFDYIIANTSYKEGAVDNQNICSVFLTHDSVCQGYSKATQLLLLQLGVDSTVVIGNALNSSHCWNLAKADGDWYYLDTTWGDGDYQASTEDDAASSSVYITNYDYFLITSATLYKTHSPQTPVALPNCTATADNYYVHEGLFVTYVDKDWLLALFDDAAACGKSYVQFQCANATVYLDMYAYLLTENHIFDFYTNTKSVAYLNNENTYTFIFWLE